MKNRFILLLYTLLASLSSCTNAVQADTHEPRIFEYASIYIPGSETAEATSLGLNSIDSDWGLWGHNLSSVLPAKPSQTIYAKQNGSADRSQFCFSSNQLYEYIESYIIDHYGERKRNRFAILPNDNDHVCTCPECTAAGNTKQDASPALFRLISRLAERFPTYQFVVAGVHWLDRSLYDPHIAGTPIRYVCDQTYETLAAAEAAIVTSGTATLETALLGIPEVVVYRTLWLQVKLRPYVLKVPWVSLVNLNLQRESVAEIIQSDLDITQAERELRAILKGGEKRARMEADFAELQRIIGGPGASDRFARRMVEFLKK